MKKTLWVVSGGIEAVAGIQIAQKLGLHVVVSDGNPHAPGFSLADDTILADTYGVEDTVAKAKSYHKNIRPIHGVICIAADVPLTVATIAQALGLPGIPIESARLAMDKHLMKERFCADGVPVPRFRRVKSGPEISEGIQEWEGAVVVKPVDSRGARGVVRVTERVDVDWAFEHAKSQSPSGRVLMEEYLTGPQVSTESMILNGVAYTPGFSDRNYEFLERYAPHMIENGGELPSNLSPLEKNRVCAVVQKAAASLGIRNGVVKGDIVISQDRVYVIEIAPRLSGGYFCSHEIPLNTGVNFVEQAIYLALGEQPDPSFLKPRYQVGVAQRYLFPKPGRVIRISNVEEARLSSGVALCEIRVKIGDAIGPIYDHPARAGVIIATGQNRQDALFNVQTAVKMIKIDTIPV